METIAYATVPGFRRLLLDLHLPATAQPSPVVVYIPGGGWMFADRGQPIPGMEALDAVGQFVGAGFAVASLDYRLSGETKFPSQLHDVKAAVRWLRANADTCGLDGERIVAWGESAGGHLAALLGLTGQGGGSLEGSVGTLDHSSAVCGVIDWYGPTDLVALAGLPGGPFGLGHNSLASPEGALLGVIVSEHPDAAIAASPVTYVSSAAPPFQIKHGTVDSWVPASQSVALADALNACGVPVDLELIEGAEHIWRGAPDPGKILSDAIEFARRVTASASL